MENTQVLNQLVQALQGVFSPSDVSAEFGFIAPVKQTSSNKFIFISRDQVGDACWYTLSSESKAVACPTNTLRGTLKAIYQIDTTRGNKGQYKAIKMRLEIAAGPMTYTIESGEDTALAQGIASSILFGNIQLGDTISIQVTPAVENEKVVFANVSDANGSRIIAPKDFARAGAVSRAQQALGCVAPVKKEYDKPYSQPTGLPPVALNNEAVIMEYDDIPF